MKKFETVQAQRNRKPFLTENKEYVILDKNDNKYKVVNDLGKESWESQHDFYWSTKPYEWGWNAKGTFLIALSTPTGAIVYDKEERTLYFGIGLCFFVFLVGYTRKPVINKSK